MTHAAKLVPSAVEVVTLSLDTTMPLPGAKMVTLGPKLENRAKVSFVAVAPTVIAPGTRAGETVLALAGPFPAATMTGMPWSMALDTCRIHVSACDVQSVEREDTHYSVKELIFD